MFYVYILRSERKRSELYTGCTADLRRRISEHNPGKSVHTNKFRPWRLEAYAAFREKPIAERFERYLKSGSGRSSAGRHLLGPE